MDSRCAFFRIASRFHRIRNQHIGNSLLESVDICLRPFRNYDTDYGDLRYGAIIAVAYIQQKLRCSPIAQHFIGAIPHRRHIDSVLRVCLPLIISSGNDRKPQRTDISAEWLVK